MQEDELNHNNENEHIEYHEFSESIEVSEDDAIPDGKHLVKKKRRERLVRKGRMKQERFRAFVRFFLSIFLLNLPQHCGILVSSRRFAPPCPRTGIDGCTAS